MKCLSYSTMEMTSKFSSGGLLPGGADGERDKWKQPHPTSWLTRLKSHLGLIMSIALVLHYSILPKIFHPIGEPDMAPISADGASPLRTCLRSVCAGKNDCVAFPGDPGYHMYWVKPYNLAIDITPAAVVRPRTTQQVANVVKCALASKVKVQARSGGHSFANYGLGGVDGAVSVDMVNFQGFSMDKQTWYATVGAGSRLGELDVKLHGAGGRAFAHGVCPGVGLGGHATIGGLGPMSRMWGAALDHIVEVEVVTANGSVLRASTTQNADLFFGLRGAGASFGIITEFVMRTHPEPTSVVQYVYNFNFGDMSEMGPVYKAWQDLVADPTLDRRFGTELVMCPIGVIITGTFYGTEDEFKKTGIIQRLPHGKDPRSITVTDWMGSLIFEAQKAALYLSDMSSPFYSKSLGFKREDVLSAGAINDLFRYTDDTAKGTVLWFIIFDATGGAVADVAMNATGYAHRDKIFFYQSYAVDLWDLSNTTRAFLNGFHKQLRDTIPADVYGTYPGYVDPELTDAQAEYWMSNLPELMRVKSRWDPLDLFHNPQSVPVAR